MDRCDETLQNAVPSTWDINELVRLLRQERLFVSSEQQELQSLNEKVAEDTDKISQNAWVTAQQRVNLNKLIVSRPDCSPALCCQRASSLETTLFVDANKVLQYQDIVAYADFIRALRLAPELIAQCLVVGERVPESAKLLSDVVHCLVTGLYGNLILPDDTLLVLQLLRQLAKLQLAASDDPRKLLRNRSCAFSKLYSTFHEGLFSAKLFLTAALQGPIMHLLTETEYYYDIDPNKAVIRFSPADRIKKFGREGTPDYAARIKQYRKWTVQNLVNITNRFIVSLQENIHCFPKSVCWLVKHIAAMLNKCGTLEPKEVNAMCTDLILTHFICLAVVNPEVYGVCDAPISPVARFNLMQIGQILQMLSLMKYQEPDPKLLDLYSSFDQNLVPSLLEGLLNGLEDPEDGPISVNGAAIQGLKRTTALFTGNELQCLVTFLQSVHASLTQEQAIASEQGSQSSSYSGSDSGFPTALRDQLGMLISALPTTVMNGTSSPKREPQQNGICTENAAKRAGILGKVSKSRLNRAYSSPGPSTHNHDSYDNLPSSHNSYHKSSTSATNGETAETVLIIPLLVEDNEHIGLLTEQKVLSMTPIKTITNELENLHISNSFENLIPEQDCEERDRLPDAGVLNLNSGQEKRTRFSHSHDEGSIGNTSDNLEAISEAASNHSVASSLELENEDQNDNDNLSDMVSANVSGRGTPNISGRDTPSSQITEGEERQLEVRQVYLPPPQSLISKQIRSEIDDKFCKFEIKKLLEGDETISIISDTWSTDVLASDSEIIEAHERSNVPPPIVEQPVVEPVVQQLLDVSETASESAWSTDVLASDSERMTEVDTDDTASVARSDDTARSEVDETPPTVSNLLPEIPQVPAPVAIAPPVSHPVSTNPFVNPPQLDNTRPLVIAYPPQSPTVSYMFRPIRDDVPNSPTRNDFHEPNFNVTGRGGRKSDYRRRTVEYVDSNANNVVHNSVVYSENNHISPRNVTSNGVERMVNHVENIERSILRTSNIHNIENISSRREAILIDSNMLNSNGLQSLAERKSIDSNNMEDVTSASGLNNDIVNHIGMAAVSPAFLLANHVGAQKFIPKSNKNENDMIRSSNASLNSMSSGSSSSSESRNKTCNGLNNECPVDVRVQWTVDNNKQWLNNGSENSLNITSTPSGSTSELSVLSPTNTQLSPVNNVNPKNNSSSSSNPSSIKPSTSTGAIPKSISFDMTAEKGDKDLDDDKKNSRGFFGKLRMGFRNRRGKSLRGVDDLSRYETGDGDGPRLRRHADTSVSRSHTTASTSNETSEDILAKYRRKPSTTSDTNTTDSAASSVKSKGTELEDERLNIDPANIEGSFPFVDAKKKLRLVLSTSDAQYASLETAKRASGQNMNELVAFLQLQLAKARNLKDWPLVARVSETLRCVRLFDDEGCRKLCQALKEDYCKRSMYNQYLLRCRQVLLSTLSYLNSLQIQIQSERELSSTCLVALCVRIFLERQEPHVLSFCDEFSQLKVSDEKRDLLESFLQTLASDLEKDSIWHAASNAQLEQARIAIEHTVMSRVYPHALYPNGEADVYRDQVLYDHIRKLARHITPNHKDLLIDKALQYECPWPCAQEALSVMAAYKTPRDKIYCVVRCASCIMDLLSMSSVRGVPTADDFTPVLVYVIIKANPQSLLSTIQYVNCFYGNRLCGEEQYWWTQFCAAVEFIKTMEYTD